MGSDQESGPEGGRGAGHVRARCVARCGDAGGSGGAGEGDAGVDSGDEGAAGCGLTQLEEDLHWIRIYPDFNWNTHVISKKRKGARVIKKYDTAQTPYQRTLASHQVSKTVKTKLMKQYRRLDSIILLSQLQALQDQLWAYAYLPSQEVDTQSDDRSDPARGVVVDVKTRIDLSRLKSIALTSGDGASEPTLLTESATSTSSKERLYRKKRRKGRYHLVKHTWRTRPDPFAAVKDEIEETLRRHPHREAKSIFLDLQKKYPGDFSDGQLRTLQRRVKAWRLQQATAVTEEIELVMNAGTSGSNDSVG